MEQIPVKLYGLFGKFKPVEYLLDENLTSQFDRESIIEVEDRSYEISSMFKSGFQLFINLKLIPNPHLYEPRPHLALPKTA